MDNWFIQGILTNGAWWLLLFVGGAAVGVVKVKKPAWAPPLLYGLAATACLCVVFFTFTGRGLFTPAPVNSSNIEPNLKKWMAYYGFGTQTVSPAPASADFAYKVVLSNGQPILIYRDIKNRPGYLQMQATIAVSPEHVTLLAKLSQQDALGVVEETDAEFLRRDLAYSMTGKDPNHVEQFTVVKSVVIDGLTQTGFGAAVDNLESTVGLATNRFVLSLQRYAQSEKVAP